MFPAQGSFYFTYHASQSDDCEDHETLEQARGEGPTTTAKTAEKTGTSHNRVCQKRD